MLRLTSFAHTITPPIPLPLITLFDIRIRTWISNPNVETEWAAGRVSHLQERGEAAVKHLLRLQQAHRDYALRAEEEPEPSEMAAAVARGHGNGGNFNNGFISALVCDANLPTRLVMSAVLQAQSLLADGAGIVITLKNFDGAW